MRRTWMKTLALLLSLLTLGALGLVACGGDDDEGTPAEATASQDTTAEARFPPEKAPVAKLSPEQVQELKRGKQVQKLRRAANDWASRFPTNNCNRYMGQPLCERLQCARGAADPPRWSENCTPVSRAFQKSFADATVEEIKFTGGAVLPSGREYYATVKFSNGEVVVFWGGPGPEPPAGSCAGPGSGCVWNVAEPDQNRRFFQAAAPRK
jgi:hypothetical protein